LGRGEVVDADSLVEDGWDCWQQRRRSEFLVRWLDRSSSAISLSEVRPVVVLVVADDDGRSSSLLLGLSIPRSLSKSLSRSYLPG